MPKIYLINLPAPFMLNEMIHPPMGLMYLHEYLTINGIEVPPIVDLAGKKESQWEIPDDGEYYGISSTTPQYLTAVKVARKIKQQNPQAKTILGGIHATALHEKLKGGPFDIIVPGEGELNLLAIISEDKWWENNKHTCYEHGHNIDNFPHPKLSSLPHKYILKQTYAFQGKTVERDAGWLMTSRGCPHSCIFCGSHCMWQSKVRFHSIKYLEEWIEYWLNMGINNFHFIDEQIAFNEKRITDICKLMKRTKGYWKCLVRGDTITPKRAKMMYESGCRQIIIGIESGSQRLLDLCNKKESVYDNEMAIEIAHEAGMGVKASLMVGLPTETQDDIDMTAEFLRTTQPEEAGIFIFVPYPGTEVYNNPEKFGYEFRLNTWDEYVCIGRDYFTPVLEEGKEEEIRNRKFQLLKVVGKNYILDKHKERWNRWGSS